MPDSHARPDYPYGSAPLRPQWRERWAQRLAVLVVTCMLLSLLFHRAEWPMERIELLIIFPALLGITLVFAPDPPALISRLAKRLTVAGCAVGTLSGAFLALIIFAVPVLLGASVEIGTL